MTVTSSYVREIFKSLKYGDGAAFFAHVAADVDWSVTGAHPFAGNYRSRAALIAGTSAKLGQVLPEGAQFHVEHLVVRNNQASIGLHALVAAKNGMWFDNHYRGIVYFRGEKIVGVRGYPESAINGAAALSSEPPPQHIESGQIRREPMTINVQRRTRHGSPTAVSGVQFGSRQRQYGKQVYALRAMDGHALDVGGG
jgi:uncharacterized protein